MPHASARRAAELTSTVAAASSRRAWTSSCSAWSACAAALASRQRPAAAQTDSADRHERGQQRIRAHLVHLQQVRTPTDLARSTGPTSLAATLAGKLAEMAATLAGNLAEMAATNPARIPARRAVTLAGQPRVARPAAHRSTLGGGAPWPPTTRETARSTALLIDRLHHHAHPPKQTRPPAGPPDRPSIYGAHQTDDRLLLPVEEAARRLSIGRSLLYELLASGEIHSVHVGRLRRVPVTALIDFINRPLDRTRPDGARSIKEPAPALLLTRKQCAQLMAGRAVRSVRPTNRAETAPDPSLGSLAGAFTSDVRRCVSGTIRGHPGASAVDIC